MAKGLLTLLIKLIQTNVDGVRPKAYKLIKLIYKRLFGLSTH